MDLDIGKKPARKDIVYVRFAPEELAEIKKLAARLQSTKSEAVRALTLKALKTIKAPKEKK